MKRINFVIAGNSVSLPVRSDGETPIPLCWLVQPFDLDRGWPSAAYFVEKITSDFIAVIPCRDGANTVFFPPSLVARANRWILAVSDGPVGRVVLSGAAGDFTISLTAGRDWLSWFSNNPYFFDPSGVKWSLAPGSAAKALWPIDRNSVEIRSQSGIRKTVSAFDYFLIQVGFRDGFSGCWDSEEN